MYLTPKIRYHYTLELKASVLQMSYTDPELNKVRQKNVMNGTCPPPTRTILFCFFAFFRDASPIVALGGAFCPASTPPVAADVEAEKMQSHWLYR